MKLCLDTYALIEIEKQSPSYSTLIDQECITTAPALGEFYYTLTRLKNEKTAEFWAKKLLPLTEEVNKQVWLKAMSFRARHYKEKFSAIDALGYTFAKKNNYLFVTGDEAFKNKPGVMFIK